MASEEAAKTKGKGKGEEEEGVFGVEEIGRRIRTEVGVSVAYLCCPYGFHVIAAPKLANHVATCKDRAAATSSSAVRAHRCCWAVCPRNATHAVRADALAVHCERCGGVSSSSSSSSAVVVTRSADVVPQGPTSSCRACGAAVAMCEWECWWCHALFPHTLTAAEKDAMAVKPAYDAFRSFRAKEALLLQQQQQSSPPSKQQQQQQQRRGASAEMIALERQKTHPYSKK